MSIETDIFKGSIGLIPWTGEFQNPDEVA